MAFDKNDTIDYLFISHLDFDHVSLVNTLIESVDGKVRNIVLPLVYKEEVRIGINLNYIANHQETETFLRWILNRVDGNNNGIDTRITFIGSNDDKGNVTEGGAVINLKMEDGESDWVLIPRNISAMSRRNELLDKFDRMLSDPDFKEESIWSGLPVVGSSDELIHLLLDERYVAGIINNKKLRKAIKSAYEKVAGGVNLNSLLLYSGPAKEGLSYMMYLMYSNLFKRIRHLRHNMWQTILFHQICQNLP